jgi:prepilin-type N-terminal cleavage/methylation domain-containing protein
MKRGLVHHARGFTLTEMLVVIVIISLLSGAAVVALQGRAAPYALRKSADDLAAAMMFANERARIEKVTHRVVILAESNSMRVERASETQADQYLPVAGRAGLLRPLAKHSHLVRVPLNGSTTAVESLVFDGNMEASSPLELRDDSGAKIQIVALPATGQILLH